MWVWCAMNVFANVSHDWQVFVRCSGLCARVLQFTSRQHHALELCRQRCVVGVVCMVQNPIHEIHLMKIGAALQRHSVHLAECWNQPCKFRFSIGWNILVGQTLFLGGSFQIIWILGGSLEVMCGDVVLTFRRKWFEMRQKTQNKFSTKYVALSRYEVNFILCPSTG